MPVDGAQLHAQLHLGGLGATPHLASGSAQGYETTHQMEPVHRGDQVEERVRRIGRHEIPSDNQLLPRQELPGQEYDGGYSSPEQPDDDTFEVIAARSQIRPLQGYTAQDQDARVEPEQLGHGQ